MFGACQWRTGGFDVSMQAILCHATSRYRFKFQYIALTKLCREHLAQLKHFLIFIHGLGVEPKQLSAGDINTSWNLKKITFDPEQYNDTTACFRLTDQAVLIGFYVVIHVPHLKGRAIDYSKCDLH